MEFKMQIDFDETQNEYYLKFLDIDDRAKKSRFLKRLREAGHNTVTMTIDEIGDSPTDSQKGMFKAFLILLQNYTGHDKDEILDSIYRELGLSKEDIDNFTKNEYSAFIERLFYYCSYNVGIEVQLVNDKLTIMKNKDE